MTKCAGLNCLTELFPKAHYERDQLDQIITNTLIPGLDDTDLFIRALVRQQIKEGAIFINFLI